MATTAGKILLCTAVSAASVGGVYATTERIELPGDNDPPSAEEAPGVDGDVETGPLVEQADPPVGSEAEEATPAPKGHQSGEVEVPAGMGLEGCDRGQAIAAAASSNAVEDRQGSGSPVDPCTRRDERAPGEPPGLDRDADTSDELLHGRPEKPPHAPGGLDDAGPPAGPGRSNGRGNGK